jgi:GcrA cell cycle regulator
MPMAFLAIGKAVPIAGESARAARSIRIAARGVMAQHREVSDMDWTTNAVKWLKKLWADGLSASQIAAELGGVSRNSVIGKVHRLGLPGRPKRPAGTIPRRRKPRSQGATIRIVRPAVRGNTALASTHVFEPAHAPEPEVIENIIPIGQRCSTLELSEGKCRWPIGDPSTPDFFFCGGKTIEGLPYCGYHARIAYQPGVDRRRDCRTAREALAQAAE